jgi:hypothetical protein
MTTAPRPPPTASTERERARRSSRPAQPRPLLLLRPRMRTRPAGPRVARTPIAARARSQRSHHPPPHSASIQPSIPTATICSSRFLPGPPWQAAPDGLSAPRCWTSRLGIFPFTPRAASRAARIPSYRRWADTGTRDCRCCRTSYAAGAVAGCRPVSSPAYSSHRHQRRMLSINLPSSTTLASPHN